MTRTRIKICGIKTIPVALAAAQAGADSIGLVFAQKSPRCVTVQQAEKIVRCLPPFVEPVGLFVDFSAQQILEIAEQTNLRTVQLHGQETPELAGELLSLRVVKAIHFDKNFENNFQLWNQQKNNLCGLLIDTPPLAEAVIPGGSGRAVDWQALGDRLSQVADASSAPIILAGGLEAQNVGRAIEIVKPWAVDVSSKVESSPGVKDITKIEDFCKAVFSLSLITGN